MKPSEPPTLSNLSARLLRAPLILVLAACGEVVSADATDAGSDHDGAANRADARPARDSGPDGSIADADPNALDGPVNTGSTDAAMSITDASTLDAPDADFKNCTLLALDTVCTLGDGCYYQETGLAGICMPAGTGVPGASCSAQNDCKSNHACLGSPGFKTCYKLCAPPGAADPPQCPADDVCGSFVKSDDTPETEVGGCI